MGLLWSQRLLAPRHGAPGAEAVTTFTVTRGGRLLASTRLTPGRRGDHNRPADDGLGGGIRR